MKPPNKAGRPVAEAVERRAEAKEKRTDAARAGHSAGKACHRRIHTFEQRPSQTSRALLRRNAAWIAVGTSHPSIEKPCSILQAEPPPLRGEDLPEVFLKQIASLTITRTRCSTFGNGPGLRRQERRASPLRAEALRRGITVFVPTPRLRGGFKKLDPRRLPPAIAAPLRRSGTM
jgi:hypothetical protein